MQATTASGNEEKLELPGIDTPLGNLDVTVAEVDDSGKWGYV